MNSNFDFLSSTRFWQLALVGISIGLFVAYPEIPFTKFLSAAVGVWFGGSVVVRTVDKVTEVKPVTTTTSVDNTVVTKASTPV